MIVNTDYVLSWRSKGLFAESIKPPTTSEFYDIMIQKQE